MPFQPMMSTSVACGSNDVSAVRWALGQAKSATPFVAVGRAKHGTHGRFVPGPTTKLPVSENGPGGSNIVDAHARGDPLPSRSVHGWLRMTEPTTSRHQLAEP